MERRREAGLMLGWPVATFAATLRMLPQVAAPYWRMSLLVRLGIRSNRLVAIAVTAARTEPCQTFSTHRCFKVIASRKWVAHHFFCVFRFSNSAVDLREDCSAPAIAIQLAAHLGATSH